MAMINGTPGDDVLLNNVGEDDVIDGQEGTDTVSYACAGGVIVDLSAGGAFDPVNGDTDELISIENVTGSEFDDLIIGDAGANVLDGRAGSDFLDGGYGNDTLIGGPGGDTLVGGEGTDTASYASASAGVVVNLADGVATNDGDDGADTLGGIENVTGSASNDSLTGDGGANVLQGGAGNDTLTGDGGADVFKYSFTLDEAPGEAKIFKFTDWLSEKYGKEFGDQLPDFERGHDHHHGHHHHKHGGRDDHGRYDDHGRHHDKHGGCDDHQPQHYGLSKAFFSQNYSEWLRDVVVPDLEAQGLAYDANGNGRIGVRLNQHDPDGTPRIEGLTNEQLSEIFGDRDEVTLRHGHHGHDAWYSNSYTSSSSGGETIVASNDGFDTIVDFDNGADKLRFDFAADDNWGDPFVVPSDEIATKAAQIEFLEIFFVISQVDPFGTPDVSTDDSTRISLNDNSWSTTLEGTQLDTPDVFAALDIYVNDILIG